MEEFETEIDEAVLEWEQGVFQFSHLHRHESELLDGPGFYALLAASRNKGQRRWTNLKLLYLGQAYRQTLRERIPQDHPAYEDIASYLEKYPDKRLIVMVGTIVEATLERHTPQFYDDVENCLILANEPRFNRRGTRSYSGRELRVTNTGDHHPLHAEAMIVGD
jgi:hypothetical protein